MNDIPDSVVIARTQVWLERAVIGLNLCPFAKAEHVHGRIRYAVSAAETRAALLQDLEAELQFLVAAARDETATTLLIHPRVLNDFLDYADFLHDADARLAELDLEGVLQIASFHPDYQFADAGPADIENYSNRSPYPVLHLLREADIEAAVGRFPDIADIYLNNMVTLRELGMDGWRRLMEDETGIGGGAIP